MLELQQRTEQCPYCGENIDILIDCSIEHQNYTEDCQICCQPINIDATVTHENKISIYLSQENE